LKQLKFLFLLISLLSLCSCSGGGGGGGDSEESSEDSSNGRTTLPGLRIIHGSIDGSPLTAKISGLGVQTARYVEPRFFSRIEEGQDVNIVIDRARSIGVGLTNFVTDIENGNEYTVFVFGSVSDDTATARLLVEPVIQPDDGFARIRILNALEGSGGVVLETLGLVQEAESIGEATEFSEIPSGPRTLFVRTDTGSPLGSLEIEVENRSEISVLVTGSLELGVVYVKAYTDFD